MALLAGPGVRRRAADISGMLPLTRDLLAEHTCPLPLPAHAAADEVRVGLDTGCLALMDVDTAPDVWDDFLYDGHGHDHGAGRLMLNPASLGTHLDFESAVDATVYRDGAGAVVAVDVTLSAWTEDVGHGRRPYGWTEADEADFQQSMWETFESGWTPVCDVPLRSGRAVLGDPAGLPDADGSGGLLDLRWPAAGGLLRISVLSGRGFRRLLRVLWCPGAAADTA